MWNADLPKISDGQVAGKSQGLSSSHGQCLLAEAEGEEARAGFLGEVEE